ncbi:MAG: hypothetical protein HY403_03315, partial [Elusimicrobia bacterium]|nr:hypothetical protein [Elusimicrobiota bacterium]
MTIQGAVDLIPTPLTGPACVVIQDAAMYSEQVTVRNFTNNGSSITIMVDPAVGGRPMVAPNNVASTAAFVIANASVNILGLDIRPAQAASYGVYASSAYVRISSVNVDSGGTIGYAGVVISSWSSVDRTSVTVQTGYGIWLAGSVMTTVEYSTADSAGQRGLFIDGGSSNTIRAVVAKTAVHAIMLQSSNYNSILLSSGTGSSAGLWIYGSNDNVVDGGYFHGGRGAYISAGSRNSVNQSVL